MRYIWTILGIVLIIILGVVLIRNRSQNNAASKSPVQAVKLADYSSKVLASAQYTVDGPINAPENHKSIRITVSPNARSIDLVQGYQGNVVKHADFGNDTNSFFNFLSALERARFTSKRPTKASYDAACPTTNRYTYILREGSKDVSNLWSAKCATGTFAGDPALANQLFQAQIPDYSAFVSSFGLY